MPFLFATVMVVKFQGVGRKNYRKMYITGNITPTAVEKLQNKQHSEHHFLIGACLTFTFNNRFYDIHSKQLHTQQVILKGYYNLVISQQSLFLNRSCSVYSSVDMKTV